MPLSNGLKEMPRFVKWRLSHSCLLRQSFAGQGKHEQNLLKVPASAVD
jgi:hypothetical protein